MASNSAFIYKPFKDPENQLRLLHIEPVSDELGEALHGTLYTFSHEDAPPYRPVSYTWGTQEASSDLLLRHPGEQEWHHFPIRPNLEALLKQFRAFVRPSRITEYFWIDAICINQRDDGEKGYQVRNMHKVYRYRGVAIWLGETSDNSDLAMDLVDRFEKIVTVADNGIKNGSSPTDLVDPFNALARETDDESWQAFYDLISRPWFSRRWIVQEYVLSAYKHFWVGHRATSIGMIMGLVRLFRLQPRYLDLRQKKSNYCHRDPYHVHELLTPELDPVERIIRLSTASNAFHGGKTSELTLERLLDNFAGFSSFDPRDGIYAFLSIASDIDVSEWFPDYSSTAKTVHVYALAAMHIMKASGKSDIICRRAQRKGQSSVSNKSGWVPWFGPQTVTFASPKNDNEEPSHAPHEHTHELHGYHTLSLTTFGQPNNRLKRGEPGWISHAICSGCGKDVPGNGVQCLNCTNFHYCKECARKSDLTHDPGHQFALHNGEIYHASGGTVVDIRPNHLRLCSCPLPDCFARVDLKAFIVDTLGEDGPESTMRILHDNEGSTVTGHFNKWTEMPGMREHFDENGVPDEMFCRTITGNRMVTRRQVHHLTDSTIEMVQKFICEASKNVQHTAAFMEGKSLPLPPKDRSIYESFEIMLSRQRKFMITNKTFGLVPRQSRPGDKIAIIIGCSVPVVIREIDAMYQGEKVWTLIGECYIDGLMDGEFMGGLTEEDTPENVTLI